MSIRTKLFFVTLISTIIPFACLLYGVRKPAEESLTQATGSKCEELASYASNALDQLLYVRRLDLEGYSKKIILPEIKLPETLSKLSETLKSWKHEYGVYSALHFINNSGKIIATSEASTLGKNVDNEVWYTSTLQLLNFTPPMVGSDNNQIQAVISDMEYDSLSGAYGITFAIPIFSSNPNAVEQLGILVSRLNWSEIYNITNSIRVTVGTQNENSYAIAINRQGQVITGPGFLLAGASNEDKNKNPEILFSQNLNDRGWESVKKALAGEKGFATEISGSEKFVVGYAGSTGYLNFKGLGWAVLVVQNTTETFAILIAKTKLVILIAAIIVAIAIAFSFYFGTSLRSRIQGIIEYTATIRKGYTKERMQTVGNDEVAALSRNLNTMAESIDNLIENNKTMRDRAEAANRQKGLFLADLAEELRTPLSNLLEMNEALLATQLSADQRSVLNTIRKTATSIVACANEIRDIAKIETGQAEIENKPFDLKTLVEEVVDVISVSAERMGIGIEMQYDPSLPQICKSDAVRLHQLFTNILAYALKYCRQSRLYMTLSSDGQQQQTVSFRAVVADSSIASNTARLKHLVSESMSNTAAHSTETFSPDLTTSRRLAELFGGSLGVVLAPDDGIVLWMNLPLKVE